MSDAQAECQIIDRLSFREFFGLSSGNRQKKGAVNKMHEKGGKNAPLTDEQKASNKDKSETRARVEHVFGFMICGMGRLCELVIGTRRAAGAIGLINTDQASRNQAHPRETRRPHACRRPLPGRTALYDGLNCRKTKILSIKNDKLDEIAQIKRALKHPKATAKRRVFYSTACFENGAFILNCWEWDY